MTKPHGKKATTILRREKEDPVSDFWHTLIVGVPIGVVLFLTLPVVFRFFAD